MTKSNALERLRARMTPEYVAEMKRKRIEEKQKLTTEWQFGYYVGEDLVHRFLPTLSVEPGTRNRIDVSEEDALEYDRIHNEWYENYKEGISEVPEEWTRYQEYREVMKKKYLPNPLQCHFSVLNITNMDEFKDGFIWSLWDCDHCNYDLKPENIKIYDDEDCYFTIIELKLDEN